MTLTKVNAEIAKMLAHLAANPALLNPAALDQLATLNGRREALLWMEPIPAADQGRAARESITNLAANSGNLRGADVASMLGALAVYGTFAKMP